MSTELNALEKGSIVIRHLDLSEEMKMDAIKFSEEALQCKMAPKTMSFHIKQEFERKYGPVWHCVVGKNFASYVTHEAEHFIHFLLGDLGIILYKCGESSMRKTGDQVPEDYI
ncbi:Dynein light chain like [Paragonimus heterotremus]|uniref:Dynein light chain n=1 Tax=Paragonimus heterotremus TaxID=100268 RepID=A0A8J4WJG9_9TREM|nr:Dynein light chain like [Paragonimus heterotremus]